jgi:hypothetical protein
MSLENAILEHAAAVRELALAIGQMGGAFAGGGPLVVNSSVTTGDAEVKEAVAKLEGAAKKQKVESKTTTAGAASPDVGAASKDAEVKNAAGAADQTPSGNTAGSAKALDYTKDVKPTLVKYGAKMGKPALVALLGRFDARNGDSLKPEQLPEILAAAQEELAAA